MKILMGILYISTLLIVIACTKRMDSGGFTNAKVVQTSKDGDKLTTIGNFVLTAKKEHDYPTIKIDLNKTFQKIAGFGGSFTEASAYVLQQLSTAKREEVLNAYFSSDGAAYSLTRTHMNSCDFSLGNYAYANNPGDTELETFSIAEDEDDLIPLIKDALSVQGADFKIIASPWTAPPWMKDNNDWNGGSLKEEYYPTWALFFSKYIKAYKQHGIDIWAVTVENEPLGNDANWESMIYTPRSMATFVKNHLGPQLERDGINIKILIYDQNRDHVKEWTDEILNDPGVAKYVWGTAVHWYSSTYDWYPETLNEVHEKFPDKILIHTEGCIDSEAPVWKDDEWYWKKEATDWGFVWAAEKDKYLHPKYAPVYRYARDIIGGLNSWLIGWIDWNIILDIQGGPNHVKNWCIAPVIADPEKDEVYYTPLFYVLNHFSKYIKPDAYRIGVDSEIDDLMVTACKNPDGKIVMVILNQKENPQSFFLQLELKGFEITIPGSALQTIILS